MNQIDKCIEECKSEIAWYLDSMKREIENAQRCLKKEMYDENLLDGKLKVYNKHVTILRELQQLKQEMSDVQ